MRGFVPISILLILVIAFAGFLVVPKIINNQNQITNPQVTSNSTPDPYGNWKTYKNQKQGFTIRYPRDLFIKEHITDAADFLSDANVKEASPAAIKARYSSLIDAADLKEFEKIQKAEPAAEIREPLDVKSIITKIRNLKIGDYDAIDYSINRNFSALEGPRTEHRHIYEINKRGTILSFLSTADTEGEFKMFDPIFEKMISSIKF